MKTVCIVGTSPRTFKYAPWKDTTKDIWTFNEAASLGLAKRITGMFDLHKPYIFASPNNHINPDYIQWLKQERDYPIWMQDPVAWIPGSERYPLDDALYLMRHIKRGNKPVRYFTSTVAMAIALAVLKEYERIELYGIEQAWDTEYNYQRDGTFLLIGIASHTADIIVHPKSILFKAPIYGYEEDTEIYQDEIAAAFHEAAQRVDALAPQDRILVEAMSTAFQAAQVDGNVKGYLDSLEAYQKFLIEYGHAVGAREENKRYLERGEPIGRTEIETQIHELENVVNDRLIRVNEMRGATRFVFEHMSDPSIYGRQLKDYNQAIFDHSMFSGALKENEKYIDKVDSLIRTVRGLQAIRNC